MSAGELLATIENPTLDYNASSSQADYTNAVANVSTARIQEQNQRVQYQAQVDTSKSALDEARRVYVADAALLDQKAIARSQVDADKAKLEQAQVAYDQAVQQLKLGAVSGYGMDSVQAAQANAEKSKILNSQNQQQVAFTRIVAPMSGTVQTVADRGQQSAAVHAARRRGNGRRGALLDRGRQQVRRQGPSRRAGHHQRARRSSGEYHGTGLPRARYSGPRRADRTRGAEVDRHVEHGDAGAHDDCARSIAVVSQGRYERRRRHLDQRLSRTRLSFRTTRSARTEKPRSCTSSRTAWRRSARLRSGAPATAPRKCSRA